MTDVQNIIDKLTNAISFKFKEDATSPGLTISKLRHGYYCSVVRYPRGGGAVSLKGKVASKLIVCKAQASSLEEAIKDVAKQFVNTNKAQPDPLQELSEVVKGL